MRTRNYLITVDAADDGWAVSVTDRHGVTFAREQFAVETDAEDRAADLRMRAREIESYAH